MLKRGSFAVDYCNLEIGIVLRKAFDIYYSSKLAEQISNNSYGIENMDAKYLAEDLIENESELFNRIK